jgi:hypothetical protein
MKDSLVPRGLWTSKMADFVKTPADISEFWHFMNDEYLAYFDMNLPDFPELPTKENLLSLAKIIYQLGLSSLLERSNAVASKVFKEAGLQLYFLAESFSVETTPEVRDRLRRLRAIVQETYTTVSIGCERLSEGRSRAHVKRRKQM